MDASANAVKILLNSFYGKLGQKPFPIVKIMTKNQYTNLTDSQ